METELKLDKCPLRKRMGRNDYCIGDKNVLCDYKGSKGALLRSKEYYGYYAQCLFISQKFEKDKELVEYL